MDPNYFAAKPVKRHEETYWEKTVRKCSAEPFVPIGGLGTAVILMFGLRSFVNKETHRSQHWMRARVIAQGCTVLALALGSELIKPNKPKNYEEVMERQLAADEQDKDKDWKRDQI